MKTALITGINGQDGSYLSELLLEKGYKVVGILKRNSVAETQTTRIEHIRDQLTLEYADMTDIHSLVRVLQQYRPDEVYNLAAQSHVGISFDQPVYTANATGISVLNLLEAVRLVSPKSKVYQASSSEMFGNNSNEEGYQTMDTRLEPVSPYGCAKVYGYNICNNYKNSYKMFICNGILFNHESPRRGTNFVTNKVAKEAVRIKKGLTNKLELGNLNASRDWGHAKDYVKVMWLMLQQDEPDNYICATGVSHTIKDLCETVFSYLDMDWKDYVVTNERYLRPEELEHLKGDPSKSVESLGWTLEYDFDMMMKEMVDYWMKEL